jgi:hypothetical protein
LQLLYGTNITLNQNQHHNSYFNNIATEIQNKILFLFISTNNVIISKSSGSGGGGGGVHTRRKGGGGYTLDGKGATGAQAITTPHRGGGGGGLHTRRKGRHRRAGHNHASQRQPLITLSEFKGSPKNGVTVGDLVTARALKRVVHGHDKLERNSKFNHSKGQAPSFKKARTNSEAFN